MSKKTLKIPVYVYFIVASIFIMVLFPREGRFRYSFNEGKPWRYGLLTAPFDFPIYKSEPELKKEQDSILSSFHPYFQENDVTGTERIRQFQSDYKEKWNFHYLNYTTQVLEKIYAAGIVPVDDYNFLRDHQYNYLNAIQKNEAALRSSNIVFTVKSAYSYILDNCPPDLSIQILKSGNLNNYLVENLKYDERMSENVKNEILSQISPANGMVQAGEKIVDRGEIINDQTYNILSSLKKVYESRTGNVQRQGGLISGIFVLVVVLMVCYLLYLYYFRSNIYERKKHVVFMLFLLVSFTLLTEISIKYQLFNVYIIPFAIIPIAVRIFFDSRTAQMTHSITILICALMVSFPFEFILLQFTTCMVVMFVLKDLTKRAQLIQCSIYILITYIVVYFGLVMLQEGDWMKVNWKMFFYFGINFLFLLFTYAFIYIIEKVFGYISNVSLVELSDINSPVLRELSETCPGTFQHSLQVSILGTAAATKVGANAQLIRTGALYHDIGKMVNPAFFTENQHGDTNPHDRLSFEQSAQIIINHVSEGVRIARKHNIPGMIIDFIITHHGKGKTKYFYNSYRNKFPDRPVNEELFTYPGPNPWTKETAILMMADSVEAASRSLKDYTEESITALVSKIIDTQIQEGLLDRAPLTFKNITEIKAVFIEKLITMFHSRISYPELNQKS